MDWNSVAPSRENLLIHLGSFPMSHRSGLQIDTQYYPAFVVLLPPASQLGGVDDLVRFPWADRCLHGRARTERVDEHC